MADEMARNDRSCRLDLFWIGRAEQEISRFIALDMNRWRVIFTIFTQLDRSIGRDRNVSSWDVLAGLRIIFLVIWIM